MKPENMTRESAIETLERLANFEGIIPYMMMHSVTVQDTLHYAIEKLKVEDSLSADEIIKWLADNLGKPCDYGFGGMSVDEYMYEHEPGYCDKHCGMCTDAECWRTFLTSAIKNQHEPTNLEIIRNMDDEELSILMDDLTHYDDVNYEWRSKLSPLLPFEDWKDWLNRRAICK